MHIALPLPRLLNSVKAVAAFRHLDPGPNTITASLTTEPGRLVIRAAGSAGDGQRSVTVNVHAPGVAGGQEARVDLVDFVKTLTDMYKRHGDASVTITGDKAGVNVDIEGSSARLIASYANSPKILVPPASTVTIERAEFDRAFKMVASAVSTDEDLRALCLMRLRVIESGEAWLEATDRFRLVAVPVQVSDDALAGEYFLHARTVAAILKTATGSIGLARHADLHALVIDDVAVYSAEPSDMPRMERLWPGALPLTSMTVDAKPLLKALDASRRLTDKITSIFSVILTLGEDSLNVTVHGEGYAGPTVPATREVETGAESTPSACINPGLLADAIRAVGADQVTLHFSSPTRPVAVTEAGARPDDDTVPRALAMPRRNIGPYALDGPAPTVAFDVDLDDIVAALDDVKFPSRSNTYSGLDKVLKVDANNGTVMFTTYDYEIARSVRLSAAGEGQYGTLLDTKTVTAVAKALRAASGKGARATLTLGSDYSLLAAGEFTVPLVRAKKMPYGDYPTWPTAVGECGEMPAVDVLDTYGRVHPDLTATLDRLVGDVTVTGGVETDSIFEFSDGRLTVAGRVAA